MENLSKLFLEQLAEVYDAEQRLSRVLPKLNRHVTVRALRRPLHQSTVESEGQIQRLDTVFELFGRPAIGRRCRGMVGLIEDANDLVADNKAFVSINAALACAFQKFKHFEIASYSSLVEWARQLGAHQALTLLVRTLNEEQAVERAVGEVIATDFAEGAAPSEPTITS